MIEFREEIIFFFEISNLLHRAWWQSMPITKRLNPQPYSRIGVGIIYMVGGYYYYGIPTPTVHT